MKEFLVRLFNFRVRGVSVVEVSSLSCLAVLVLAVYLFKAGAGLESAKISDLDRQITSEQKEVRRLRAELSTLQQPARIERLSEQYLGLAPTSSRQEAAPQDLAEIARRGAPAVATPATVTPAAASPASVTPATQVPVR